MPQVQHVYVRKLRRRQVHKSCTRLRVDKVYKTPQKFWNSISGIFSFAIVEIFFLCMGLGTIHYRYPLHLAYIATASLVFESSCCTYLSMCRVLSNKNIQRRSKQQERLHWSPSPGTYLLCFRRKLRVLNDVCGFVSCQGTAKSVLTLTWRHVEATSGFSAEWIRSYIVYFLFNVNHS